MAEARHPRELEIEAVAAKIWRDAFGPVRHLAWENVDPSSHMRRQVIEAARIALDPPECPAWDEDALPA